MNAKPKKTIAAIISYAYILLFIYAATSKFLDFENFGVQLGQSPLLSAFAPYIKWLVPLIEIIISGLLAFPKTRHFALYCAFTLMVMFTAYIYIILNFSSYVPCSCGGILEKLGWQEHFIFNVAFVVLAAIAIFLNDASCKIPQKSFIAVKLLSLVFISFGLMAALFFTSEEMLQHNNSFIRRFPRDYVQKAAKADLHFDSYYLAGTSGSKVYLGNYTAPLEVLELSADLKQSHKITIHLDRDDFPFRNVQVRILSPFFYVFDGKVPAIYKGTIGDWNAKLIRHGNPFFYRALPMGNSIAFRAFEAKSGENILGIIKPDPTFAAAYLPEVLQKQHDGVFDTDGTFSYSPDLRQLIYVYFYRNEFIVIGENGTVSYRGHTIDTTTQAKLRIVSVAKSGARKMAAPPYVVNKNSAVCQNLLFVHSGLRSRNETNKMWKQASVIDVYDLSTKTYQSSFYIYNSNAEKLSGFLVTTDYCYALIGKELHAYTIRKGLRRHFSKTKPTVLKKP